MDDKKDEIKSDAAAVEAPKATESKKSGKRGLTITLALLAVLLCASVGVNIYQAVNSAKDGDSGQECNAKPHEAPEAEEEPSEDTKENTGYRKEAILGDAANKGYAYGEITLDGQYFIATYDSKNSTIKLDYSSAVFLHNKEYEGVYDESVTLKLSEPIYGINNFTHGQAFSLGGTGIVVIFDGGRVGMLSMEEIIKEGKTELKAMPGIEGVVSISNVNVGDAEGISGWFSTLAIKADGSFYDLAEQKR